MYEHFELYNPFITVDLIVWSLFAGIVIASLLAVYNKRLIGGLVKTLLSEECFSPEKAKTIVELGYGTDWIIKNALRTDNALRRLVMRIDEEKEPEAGADAAAEASADKPTAKKPEFRKHDNIDFLTAKFYIPEELKYRAEVRYASRGTDFFTLIIGVVICAAAAFAAVIVIPDLIQLIDNFLGTL